MKLPVIIRIYKANQLVEVKQFDKDQIIFGHGDERGGDVDISLPDPAVSPIHCLIELRDSGYYIADLGSSSGTLNKGVPVLDEPLSSGDRLGIGPYEVQFFVGVPKPKAPPTGIAKAPEVAQPPHVETKKPEVTPIPQAARPEEAPVPVPVKTEVSVKPKPAEAPKENLSRPKIPSATEKSFKGGHSGDARAMRKARSTFAPASEIRDLREYLKPSKGSAIEVLVVWNDRVFSRKHFVAQRVITIGSNNDADIILPSTFIGPKFQFINMAQFTKVFLTATMKPELILPEKKYDLDMLYSSGKAKREKSGSSVQLEQGEMLTIKMGEDPIEIFVRFTPETAVPALSGLDLTAGEITGLIVSVLTVALLALYVSVYSPLEQPEEKKEDTLKIAKFVYTAKEVPKPEAFVKPPDTPPPPPPEQKTPPQKAQVVKETKDAKGEANKVAAGQKAATLAESLRENQNQNRQNKLSSTIHQGGSQKTTNKPAANAQSKDVTKMGLLSAFGAGGAHKEIDKAYSGSGEVLGTASKATGSSGMNTDRAGDDIGGKFKDTGAGGKGTATMGIAGIKTAGRSSGNASYGNVGISGKSSVGIQIDGASADFVGTVDREQVRRVVRSIYAQIKNCFEMGLVRDSSLEGKVIIHWQVVEQGHVKLSTVKESPAELRKVAECIALRIRDQRFPEPPGDSYYEVDYPFLMSKQN